MKSEQRTTTPWRGISVEGKIEREEVRSDLTALEQAILEDAREEARQLLADARAQAERIREQAETEAAAEQERILNRARKGTESSRDQAVALAQIEAQAFKLEHREELLAGVFDLARERLALTPGWPAYEGIARHLVRDAMEHLDTDHAMVRADAETRQVLTDEVLAELSGELGVYLRAGDVIERGTGVVLHTPDGHRRYDNTLETRLVRLQDALRAPVYRILTGEAP